MTNETATLTLPLLSEPVPLTHTISSQEAIEKERVFLTEPNGDNGGITEIPFIRPKKQPTGEPSEDIGVFSSRKEETGKHISPLIVDLSTSDTTSHLHADSRVESFGQEGAYEQQPKAEKRSLIEVISSTETNEPPQSLVEVVDSTVVPSNQSKVDLASSHRPLIEAVEEISDATLSMTSTEQRPQVKVVNSTTELTQPASSHLHSAHDQPQPESNVPHIEGGKPIPATVSSVVKTSGKKSKALIVELEGRDAMNCEETVKQSLLVMEEITQQRREQQFSVPESSETAHGGEWATLVANIPLVEEVSSESSTEEQIAQEGGILVEDLDEKEHAIQKPSESKIQPQIRLAGVPTITDQSEIDQVEMALEALRSKPESELTEEEKVWRLAAMAGSTLEGERVELDPQTKAQVRERLREAGTLEKVSLPL